MNLTSKYCLATFAWALITGLSATLSLRADTTPVVLQGETAPGGGEFLYLGGALINASGQVAFGASTTANTISDGIFRVDGSNVTALALQGQAVTAASGGPASVVLAFYDIALNRQGQVIVVAELLQDDITTSGILSTFAGTPTVIARRGDAADGGGILTGATNAVTMPDSPSTAVAYLATMEGPVPYSHSIGIFKDGLAIVRAQPPTPSNETYYHLTPPCLNNGGSIAYWSNYGPAEGVFRDTSVIALRGQSTPVGGTYEHLTHLDNSINTSGQVAFWASITGSSSSNGIFRGDGATTTAMAVAGDPAAAVGSGTNGILSSLVGDPALNDAGQVAFRADLANTSGGTNDNSGIFRSSGPGQVTQIARKGQLAPDGRSTFFGFSDPSILKGGQVLFTAGLTDGISTSFGGFLADSQEIIPVFRSGQALAGSTISSGPYLRTGIDHGGQSSVNDFGQVAFSTGLTNNSQGVFLFTPDLHDRTVGDWDTAGVWTLGFKPGSVYKVFIDPSIGTNMVGPSSNTTVKSLEVGARGAGSGNAILRLSSGAMLTSTTKITVDALGQIDVQAGTLSSASINNSGVINLQGGTLTAQSITNNLIVNYSGGSLAGPFVNYGLFNLTTCYSITTGFQNNGELMLGSSGTLRKDSGTDTTSTGPGLVSARNGSTIDVQTGAIAINGSLVTSPGAVFTKSGTGTLVINGLQAHGPGAVLNVNGGRVNINSDAGAGGANLVLNIDPANVVLNSTQRLAGLDVTLGSTATLTKDGAPGRQSDAPDSKYISTKSLTVDNISKLDLTNNTLVVDYTGAVNPLGAITKLVATGAHTYDGKAHWDGQGITSGTAATDASIDPNGSLTSLGIIDNAVAGFYDHIDGANFNLGGVGDSLPSHSILVTYTYLGDSQLAGKVQFSDFLIWKNAYRQNLLGGHVRGWQNAQFDYGESQTSFMDFLIWERSFSLAMAGRLPILRPAWAGALGAITLVPEPSASALFAIGLVLRQA